MITSLVVMPAFFNKDSFGLLVEDSSTLIQIAKYNFDLALEVDETIYISNFIFKRNYNFEARVRSKSKILKAEVMTTPNDDMYTLIMEYVVEIVKKEDLVMIREYLAHSFLSQE